MGNLFDPSSWGSSISQGINAVGNWWGGNGTNPGALGTGQYQVPPYTINQDAFNTQIQDQLGGQANNWQQGQQGMLGRSNQGAPQLGNASTYGAAASQGPNLGQYNQAYGAQSGLANQYAQMAAGHGPSMANVQAQQQGQQNLQAQLAAAGASSGSSNPALAGYNVGQQAGQIQNQTNQNAVMGRTAEEMGALGAQGNIYGQQAGEAAGMAGMGQQNNQFNAGAQNQFSMSNQNAQLQQNQMNNQMLGQYTQNEQQALNAQQQGAMAGQQLGVQNAQGYGANQAGAYASSAGNLSKLWGQGGMGSNGMMALGALFA